MQRILPMRFALSNSGYQPFLTAQASLFATIVVGVCLAALMSQAAAQEDARLDALVNLRKQHFGFTPPRSVEAWKARSQIVRQRVQIAAGLWPMPERPTPQAHVHGELRRDGFTVQKVVLESYPGHFVTGSLYRPVDATETMPGVLCPYGHWPKGRFQHSSNIDRQLASGAEKSEVTGRVPLQARCVQLARMGCMVFMYDMVGYADSVQIPFEVIHAPTAETILNEGDRWGFYSAQAEMRLQGPLGLQTYNSMCALDWLSSLPEVDASRIGITGGSSGATQTLMLCAVDDRPCVAFPVVMVSTEMQGGCPCENACCLRLGGVSNVEFAALMAPKPLGMASADDWTRNFHRDGYPELQSLYELLGVRTKVMHASLTQFPHNYNWASRQAMYPWLAKWLQLPEEVSLTERNFQPLTQAELSVWDDQHPAPAPGKHRELRLMQEMAAKSDAAWQAYRPHDEASLEQFQTMQQTAYRVLLDCPPIIPANIQVAFPEDTRSPSTPGLEVGFLNPQSQQTVAGRLLGDRKSKRVVLWIAAEGCKAIDQRPAAVQQLLDAGIAVLGVNLAKQPQPDNYQLPVVEGMRPSASLTYGYNPTLVACRANDILTALAGIGQLMPQAQVGMVATEGTAPYAAGAAALAGEQLAAAVIATSEFRFADLTDWRDPNFLPGAIKYGDLPGMLATAAPRPTLIVNDDASILEVPQEAYRASQAAGALSAVSGDEAFSQALEKLAQLLAE